MKKLDLNSFFSNGKSGLQNFWKTRKKMVIAIGAVALTVAAGLGIWFFVGNSNKEPVYVYPFQYIGMTEYWGDSQESYGPVSTDKIQTVFLSDTQKVTEIKVKEGDTVKKGDLLLSFDTTLSDLALERKRLDVEKLKLQLQDAQKELRRINSMKPMVIPEYDEEDYYEDEDRGELISDAGYEISDTPGYDGGAPERALICWVRSDVQIGDGLFYELQLAATEQKIVIEEEPEEEPEETEETQETQGETEEDTEQAPDEEETEGESSSASDALVNTFYVVFKVTSGNVSMGEKLQWQGMRISQSGDGYVFRFFNAGAVPDHMLTDEEEDSYVEGPQIDMGSGYTAAQIAQMRSEQQKKIKDLEFDVKMADANYKIMLTEVNDGNVYAQIDGTVVSLLTEDEAKQTQQPLMKVSGGGGFYIQGSISELEKDKMQPGQEVTVNDWNTGMTYTGTVDSIGDFPSTNGYYSGMGNPNASYYPFRVFVDETADLQAGSYVSILYSAGASEQGIYLENPFLRTEAGKSYVLVLGENGKLEQRFVVTGKSLWGNYTQILSGLTAEDLIAFPYGKNVKPGVPAQEGDLSNLYG